MKNNPNKKNTKPKILAKDSPLLKNEEIMDYPITFIIKDPNNEGKAFFIKYSSLERKNFIKKIENESVPKYDLLWQTPDKGSTAVPKKWLLEKLKYSVEEAVEIDSKYYCSVSVKELNNAVINTDISDKKLKQLIAKINHSLFPLLGYSDKSLQNYLHNAVKCALNGGSPLKILTLLPYVSILKSDNKDKTPYDLIKNHKFKSIFTEQPLWQQLLEPPELGFFSWSQEQFIQLSTDEEFTGKLPGFHFLDDTKDYYYVNKNGDATKIKLSENDLKCLQPLIEKHHENPEKLTGEEKSNLCLISTKALTNTLLTKHEKTLQHQYSEKEKIDDDEKSEDKKEKNNTFSP